MLENAVQEAVAEWAAADPKIKRAWVLCDGAADPQPEDLEIAVEIQPVADSEETLAVWLWKGEQWRSQLRARIGPNVKLEWVDPDRDDPALGKELEQAKVLVYERAS
jgi:hypothetical protein